MTDLQAEIDALYRELDACPNRDWFGAENQARMDLLIALVAERDGGRD